MSTLSARNLFVLAVFGFQAVSVQYASIVFTPTTRWVPIVVLAGWLLVTGYWLQGLAGLFGLILAATWVWAGLTTLWSDLFSLTAMKTVALGLVAVTFLAGGRHWVRIGRPEDALGFLLPVVGLGVVAITLAHGTESASFELGPIVVFQGLTSNPNSLGLLLVLGFPCLLWKVHAGRRRGRAVWVWGALLGLVAVGIISTHSRTAMLVGVMIVWGYAVTSGVGRRLTMAMGALLAVLTVVIAAPQVIDAIEKRYVYKGVDVEAGVLATRRDVWNESFEYAKRGGWFGGGYGVSLGNDPFAGGLSTVGYAREKGNSQLAIWEETGLVGLTLYGLQLVCLAWVLKRGIQGAPNRNIKVLMGIIAGSLAGLVVHSVFEAWWTAPGSPEFVGFWALAGVYMGLIVKRSGRARAYRSPLPEAATRARPVLVAARS